MLDFKHFSETSLLDADGLPVHIDYMYQIKRPYLNLTLKIGPDFPLH